MVPSRTLRAVATASTASSTALILLACAGSCLAASAAAQSPGSSLPAIAPTSLSAPPVIAPIAAIATPADHPGEHHHHAQVTFAGGQLTVHADNSSLNGILRSVSRCTGMKVYGGVADQRVFGDYGPDKPATVLATLLDGTGSNMVLMETAADQPAELILTPRTGGPTPPSPNEVPDDDTDTGNAPARSLNAPPAPAPQAGYAQPDNSGYTNPNQPPVPVATPGSAVTGPVSIPQPINNVNGSASNASPSASTYPTTNSVPLDSLPTPSTTPSTNGIVDSPNPPAPGSDTANLLRGVTGNTPGTTNITPAPTSSATLPGATNTTTPVPTGAVQPGADSTAAPPTGALTPQQVYQQLQQVRQQQQQQQTPTTPPPQ